ncbi:MAG: penicillin acylase family protein [Halobacteriovoraceae bacterium]|nr:penicillin acylase family protein [Halobacteriovoraceae bacterium]MCB9095367.1 penicillin acylase family protein [Halobacteriovoraceae bacterium]
MSKTLKYSLLGILLIIVGVLTFTPLGTILSYRFFPDYPTNESQTLKLNGLKAQVDVYFDEYGIPHIEAQNVEDLVRATGFVQARYRFFQLDVLRHFATGRISELVGEQPVLGSTTVEFDLAMRAWGFQKKAKVNLDDLPEFDRKVMLAFTDGINQAREQFPTIEHRILGIKPTPWLLEDTLIVSLLQAWSITHNWEQEAVRYSIALNVGLDLAEKIYDQEPPDSISTIDRKASDKKKELPEVYSNEIRSYFPKKPIAVSSTQPMRQIRSVIGDLMQTRPAASNAWVVSGKHSQSGMPVLSNDMHLTHALPSILFMQHLKSPELDVSGATLPGLPFVVGGHNKHVAWGCTSAVADVVDLVIEREDPANPGYVLNSKQKCPIVSTEEKIQIKDEASKIFKLRRTCNGFVLNDAYPKFLPDNAPLTSVRWKIPDVQKSLGHLFRANQAKTVDELREHLMKIPSPVQNITAADVNGDIAFFSVGRVPVRHHHRGTFPVPGWLEKYEWDGAIPIEQMPYIKNPARGYIINTNNQVVNPYYHRPLFHIDSAPSFRYQRVEERLKKTEKHTRDSIHEIQNDLKIVRGEILLPLFLQDLSLISSWNPIELKALEELEKWNFSTDANSIGTSIFMTIYREAIIESFSDKLTDRALHAFLKQRYSTNTVDKWFEDLNHPVFDKLLTSEKETRQTVIVKAFRIAVKKLSERFGKDTHNWKWGELHYHMPSHMFGKKKILSFMNLKRQPLGGSLDSVWKAHFNLGNEEDTYKVVAGPAYRMVVDLKNFDQAMYSIDTGVSGWPSSPHYGDQYQLWLQGKLAPMDTNWEHIRKDYQYSKMTLR